MHVFLFVYFSNSLWNFYLHMWPFVFEETLLGLKGLGYYHNRYQMQLLYSFCFETPFPNYILWRLFFVSGVISHSAVHQSNSSYNADAKFVVLRSSSFLRIPCQALLGFLSLLSGCTHPQCASYSKLLFPLALRGIRIIFQSG